MPRSILKCFGAISILGIRLNVRPVRFQILIERSIGMSWSISTESGVTMQSAAMQLTPIETALRSVSPNSR